MPPNNRDFEADIRSHVDGFLIPKYAKNMPFRLADTYTGLILEREEIVSLLKMRKDYLAKLDAVVSEAVALAAPVELECPSQRPKLHHLDAFIAQFLAFAMFSHRWRGQEPSLEDVRRVKRGIYAMDDRDVIEEEIKVIHMPKSSAAQSLSLVQKLQEFCCVAAKCGFRWAWSDTCCIKNSDYAERSESINSMFLWYSHSDLTIVYLDDVDEVVEGRLPPVPNDDGRPWFDEPEIKMPFLPLDNPTSTPHAFHAYLSLHDRLRGRQLPKDKDLPELKSMQLDAQVERPQLKSHLNKCFAGRVAGGKYHRLPEWVTRGWTLQEMLASKRLRFYSKRWTLLEEADDRDTAEAEAQFSLSSFRYRARLLNHRTHDLWREALVNTTGIAREDLEILQVGTKDVRTRLLWSARRSTTRMEDRAYCLLGIFDVSLPAMYGEGPRAFIRLQEEVMKRTGDSTLFDWCGRSSSINSFLAHSPECFMEHSLPKPVIDDSSESIFDMIMDLLRAILGLTESVFSVFKGVVLEAVAWIKNMFKSPPPGHTLTNGELNVSLFEHQVLHCEPLENASPNDPNHHYKIEADGLVPATVTLAAHAPNLVRHPTQYTLCRLWDRNTGSTFQILLEIIEYVLQDMWHAVWNPCEDASECRNPVRDEADVPGSKLREEMQAKRKAVMEFFQYPFPVYLVRLQDGYRVRVGTQNRIVSVYTKFDFSKSVVARSIL